VEALIGAIRAAGGTLATFPTDPLEGPVGAGWTEEVAKAGDVRRGDGTAGAEAYLGASKDDAGVAEIRKAGVLAARALKYVLLQDMEAAVDDAKAVSNGALAAAAAAVADDRKALEGRKVPVDSDNFDVALAPAVQSGGAYDLTVLRPGAAPPGAGAPLSYDVVLLSLGMRYKTQRAALARTYLIDPTPAMQRTYDIVEHAHASLIDKLKPGAVIKDAVLAVRDELLRADGLPLAAKLVRNFGHGIGLRVSDKALVLSHKNETVLQPGMSFLVTTGLSEVPRDDTHPVADAPANKLSTYAVFLADTVVVEAGGAVVVTDKAPRKYTSYKTYDDDEDGGDEDDEGDGAPVGPSAAGGGKPKKDRRAPVVDVTGGRDATGRSARLKEKARDVDPDAARKREEHQAELVRRRQEEAARGGRRGGGDGDGEDDIENAPDIVAYRSTADFPRGTRPNQIIVDKAHDSVLLPILGALVPFHISTIKSVNKTEEGHKAFLRINFYSPGQALGKDASPSMQAAVMRHPDCAYFRTLSFMSRDHRNFVDVDQKLKAMLKAHRTQRKEEKEASGLVEQARLLLRKDGVVPKMVDINMWPPMSGRATQGTLSAHVNGLLFVSNKGERLEIIYGNIKTAVFQPCEGEHVVLLHFHLRHPLLIGKKKFREVQFYTEVVERVVAVDGRGRSDYDPDELNEEDRERQLRVKLNKAFKTFATKVEDSAALDAASTFRTFEVPPRDLAFAGAWAKEMTTVLLSSNAIVAVVDRPPLVVPVEDIELVHFERVTHGGKSFDMVIVWRGGVVDKGTDEFIRISSIEMKHLETIKTWLDEIAEVVYTESVEALLWKPIIADHVRDPNFWLEAYADGKPKNVGLAEVLQPYEEGGGGGDGDEEEEEESEEYSDDESEEESEEDSDDDFEDLVDEDDDDDDDEDDDDDDDEDAADWDELERRAAEDDKKKRRHEEDDDDDDRAKAKRKRAK
jgi:nucleosome binding factor SPN SPT16 subunit